MSDNHTHLTTSSHSNQEANQHLPPINVDVKTSLAFNGKLEESNPQMYEQIPIRFSEQPLLIEEILKYDLFRLGPKEDQFTSKELEIILENGYLRKVPKSTTIYKEGEKCNGEIFLVLTGQVLLETEPVDFLLSENLKKLKEKAQILRFGNKALNPFDKNLQEKEILLHETHHKEQQFPAIEFNHSEDDLIKFDFEDSHRSIKNKGSHFGESALLDHQSRKETALTLTDCELLVLKQDFIIKLRDYHKSEQEAKANFILDSIPLLGELKAPKLIHSIVNCFSQRTFAQGTDITIEGHHDEYFYLIREGEVEVLKAKSIEPNSMKHVNDKEIEGVHGIKRSHKQNVEVNILSQGSLFGDEILFNESGHYDYTVIAVTPEVSVYAVERSKFFFKFPKAIYEEMKKQYEIREEQNMQILSQKAPFSHHRHDAANFAKNNYKVQSNEYVLNAHDEVPTTMEDLSGLNIVGQKVAFSQRPINPVVKHIIEQTEGHKIHNEHHHGHHSHKNQDELEKLLTHVESHNEKGVLDHKVIVKVRHTDDEKGVKIHEFKGQKVELVKNEEPDEELESPMHALNQAVILQEDSSVLQNSNREEEIERTKLIGHEDRNKDEMLLKKEEVLDRNDQKVQHNANQRKAL